MKSSNFRTLLLLGRISQSNGSLGSASHDDNINERPRDCPAGGSAIAVAAPIRNSGIMNSLSAWETELVINLTLTYRTLAALLDLVVVAVRYFSAYRRERWHACSHWARLRGA